MAFFKNIKKSFGFSDGEDDNELSYDYSDNVDTNVKKWEQKSSLVSTNNHQDESTTYSANTQQSAATENAEERLKKMQLKIFDGVVELFNMSLPDFLKSSLNVEAQKQYIFDSLDKSLRSYIINISAEARQMSEAQWDKERSKIMAEMIEIKSKCRDLESTRDDWKRQQLSAERQKRALSARLHDLEVQVASLEAEKEQYDLENKSLVNKLKVSNLKDVDVEALQDEIGRLQAALQEARNSSVSFGVESAIVAEKDAEINKLQSQIEQLKVKGEMADAMINDLNEKASTALRQLESNKNERAEMEFNSQEAATEIQNLKKQVVSLKDDLASKNKELEEANEGLQMIETIQAEMEKFESIKQKKDAKISELQKELKLHKSRIVELEKDTESLKGTIENNLYNQAISEDNLKKEIERLKKQHPIGVNIDNEKNIEEVKISAIDESLDDSDWLISIPPEGTQMRPATDATDDNFGYQEPPKKTAPDNDAQMLLW